MSSYEVVQRGAAAGIVITASHNPWVDNGFKVKAPTGSAAGPEILKAIEARIARERRARRSSAGRSPMPRRPGWSSTTTRSRATSGSSARTVDLDALKAADVHVLVDPMWGAGARLDQPAAGRRPDPGRPRSTRSATRTSAASTRSRSGRTSTRRSAMLAGGGYDLGLLLDGDADRAGAADERGTFIHQLQVTGLLMYYLAEHRGLRDPVVISVNNTSMAARLGEHYGIEVYETPVGFKYIGPKMIETGAMMGAEESGGFGFGMHLPERDGIYADLLLLDLFLREKAAGRWPVSKAIEHFHSIAGPSFYQRVDVHVERNAVPRDEAPPAGRPARAGADRAGRPAGDADASPLDTNDGFKFFVADGSWLLVRTSGTEPLVRVYTEATSAETRATRCSPPASGWSAGHDAPATTGAPPSRAGRQALGPRAHLGAHRPVRRQDPGHRDGQAAVAPAPRDQGRVDPGPVGPAAAVPRGRRRRSSAGGARSGRAAGGSRPAGSTATRRSSGASSSRSRRRSSTTSSGSRTTSDARARTRPTGAGAPRTISGVTGGARRVYPSARDRPHRSRCMTGRRPRERPTGDGGRSAMHSSLIGKVEKANCYARELDRITIDRLSLTFRGDNDTHHVGLDAGQWRCTCHYFESWGSCVHLLTLQKVFGVMLPEEAQVSIFSAEQAVATA